jgi:hypothetical protein
VVFLLVFGIATVLARFVFEMLGWLLGMRFRV